MSRLKTKTLRCAIYTRKSHEEGLEQEFNSLDAQRASAEAYILSQQHEGWQIIETRYDDGGFSGGNTQRPALTQLMDDIKFGKIDIVLVYKVDRLSRSLADFSSLIDIFDQHNVSFVSVTQQFNTSSSMGRLTLNVLLSFAQFEREVTSERIRDKIKASKQKGLWMGGNPPMGYEVIDHQLIQIPKEASFIQDLFDQYLVTPSLLSLSQRFTNQGLTTKQWISQKNRTHGGKRLSPKYLYRLLTNPVYIGKITHKKKAYDGQHQAIISQDLWDTVQSQIKRSSTQNTEQKHAFLLKGKLRHYQDFAMSPSTTKRSSTSHRFYVSQKAIKLGYKHCDIKSINADHIEEIVIAAISSLIQQQSNKALQSFLSQSFYDQHELFRKLIQQVVISPDQLNIELNTSTLEDTLFDLEQNFDNKKQETPTEASNSINLSYEPKITRTSKKMLLTLDTQIKKLDGKRFILDKTGKDLVVKENEVSPQIVKAIGLAHYWKNELNSEKYKTAKEMARQLNISYSVLLRRIHLTHLSPTIQHHALSGELSKQVSLKSLIQASQILSWEKQHQFLNI